MKLHFEPNLEYQLQAIEAVCDLFHGQEICRTEFTVTQSAAGGALLPGLESDLGIGNRLTLLDDEILTNLAHIQLRNGLPQSESLASGDFTVEMETGTGKTYVYLRTIFELNKRYGFTKFVIVVPSVAIKEGVYKSLQITEEHFKGLYAGVPFDYFLYDSAKLGQVRNFATSPQIQIMVVTVGAINKKDVNNLYKDSEKTGGEKPIDLIRATSPIVIVDEPQSVDGGLSGAGKTALDAMNPLCTLRYSATHADKHHMVYRLDAVDAYEMRLVKQIEVASATIEDAHNKPFVRLLSVSNKRGVISARVELDMKTAGGVKRQEVTVQDGDILEQTTGRAIYADRRIGETGEGRVRPNLRGGVSAAGQAPGLRGSLPGRGSGSHRRGRAQRLLLRRQEPPVDRHRREQPVQPRQRRARLQPDHEGEGTAPQLRDPAEVHLLPFCAARRLGQSQRLPNLRPARYPHRTRAPANHRPRAPAVREPARRAPARLRDQHPDRGRDRALRAVRREPAEGDRGRDRHPLRHRGTARVRRHVRARQAVLHSPEFKELWDRIKHKTTYRVQFDNEALVTSCTDALRDAPGIPKARLQWRKANIAIGRDGVEATERDGAATVVLEEADIELPDLLTDLQDRTQLTRRSIQRILTGSGRLDQFKRNPQQFIELAAEAINRCKRQVMVDGIKYQRLGDAHYYAQELFEREELTGYLKNMLDAPKSVYEQVVFDSETVERPFAEDLERNSAIKLYAKLPGWFTVSTPLGTYNPDWAVLVESDGAERLYLVVETKGSLFADDLRDKESAKIACGKAHFNALGVRESPAQYVVARSLDDVLGR